MGKVSVDVTEKITIEDLEAFNMTCLCGQNIRLWKGSGDSVIYSCPRCDRKYFWEHIFKVFEVRELDGQTQ